MQTQPTPKQATASTATGTDLKSLRLPANYGATLGVKKLLTNVSGWQTEEAAVLPHPCV